MSDKVVFMSQEHANTVFLVERKEKVIGRANDGTPIVDTDGDITAEFRNGLCQTNDPKAIKFLDAKDGVWRADDPLANYRFNLGDENVEAIEKAVLAQHAESNT